MSPPLTLAPAVFAVADKVRDFLDTLLLGPESPCAPDERLTVAFSALVTVVRSVLVSAGWSEAQIAAQLHAVADKVERHEVQQRPAPEPRADEGPPASPPFDDDRVRAEMIGVLVRALGKPPRAWTTQEASVAASLLVACGVGALRAAGVSEARADAICDGAMAVYRRPLNELLKRGGRPS